MQFGRNGRRTEHRENHRDAFDMHRHTEDDGVKVFPSHPYSRWIGGLEVLAETCLLLRRQHELPRVCIV